MSSISAQMMSSISEFRNMNGKDWHVKTAKYSELPENCVNCDRPVVDGDHMRTSPKSLHILAAQVGYIFTFAFSILETVVACTALTVITLSKPVVNVEHRTVISLCEQIRSSAFSICWSFTDILINLLVPNVAASEAQARNLFDKGELLGLPDRNIQ